MAIKLIGNYAKRLGLPGYSSHQFSVSCETELTGIERVPEEAARLYSMLQEAVDREIQQTGFVPGHDYGECPQNPQHPQPNGHSNGSPNGNGSGHPGGHPSGTGNGQANGHPARLPGEDQGAGGPWSCSDKQRQLILTLLNENALPWEDLEQLARERFGAGVRRLNKLQASGLISELLESASATPGGNGKNNGQARRAAQGKGGAR